MDLGCKDNEEFLFKYLVDRKGWKGLCGGKGLRGRPRGDNHSENDGYVRPKFRCKKIVAIGA